jgi:hypothetical protein
MNRSLDRFEVFPEKTRMIQSNKEKVLRKEMLLPFVQYGGPSNPLFLTSFASTWLVLISADGEF